MMGSILQKNPPRTLLEVFRGLPEGTLAQLIENEIVMSPAPSDSHQKILNEINFQLLGFVKNHQLGEVRVAPYDVYLDGKNAFQPDIIFVGNESLELIEEDGLHGAPDLVIEVLSPSTAKYDLDEKKDVCERHSVKEYWIVDPETKSTQGYYLDDGSFIALGKNKGVIASRLLGSDFNF